MDSQGSTHWSAAEHWHLHVHSDSHRLLFASGHGIGYHQSRCVHCAAFYLRSLVSLPQIPLNRPFSGTAVANGGLHPTLLHLGHSPSGPERNRSFHWSDQRYAHDLRQLFLFGFGERLKFASE